MISNAMRFAAAAAYVSAVFCTAAFCGHEGEPIPGSPWRVHDMKRPRPPVVKPGEKPGDPPSDAIVLFGGAKKDRAANWVQHEKKKNKEGKLRPTGRLIEPTWPVADGCMTIDPGKGSIQTKESFGSCRLHVEWSVPAGGKGTGQGKGNSGVYLMGKYEVQVLDTYNDENTTYADGQAGALYGQKPPAVNPARPAGEWNAYDIIFHAPSFKDGKVVAPATVTVLFNGVLVHDHFAMAGPSRHKKWTSYSPHPGKLPLSLQDHNNPVRYRNIWLRPLGGKKKEQK